MKISEDKLTHIETEKSDEKGVWHLISIEGGRDENGELKIKKVIRETAAKHNKTKRKSVKQSR